LRNIEWKIGVFKTKKTCFGPKDNFNGFNDDEKINVFCLWSKLKCFVESAT